MFIQIDETPNPLTLKFIPGTIVMGAGSVEFLSPESAASCPLVLSLFDVPGVRGVFLGEDFITITRDENIIWDIINPDVLDIMMDHFNNGRPLFVDTVDRPSAFEPKVFDDPIAHQIQEILETRVRPAVAMDGGDISLHDYKDGIVYLHMRGSCSGCPSSQVTLKNGIENMLRHYIPEIVEVRAVS